MDNYNRIVNAYLHLIKEDVNDVDVSTEVSDADAEEWINNHKESVDKLIADEIDYINSLRNNPITIDLTNDYMMGKVKQLAKSCLEKWKAVFKDSYDSHENLSINISIDGCKSWYKFKECMVAKIDGNEYTVEGTVINQDDEGWITRDSASVKFNLLKDFINSRSFGTTNDPIDYAFKFIMTSHLFDAIKEDQKKLEADQKKIVAAKREEIRANMGNILADFNKSKENKALIADIETYIKSGYGISLKDIDFSILSNYSNDVKEAVLTIVNDIDVGWSGLEYVDRGYLDEKAKLEACENRREAVKEEIKKYM